MNFLKITVVIYTLIEDSFKNQKKANKKRIQIKLN